MLEENGSGSFLKRNRLEKTVYLYFFLISLITVPSKPPTNIRAQNKTSPTKILVQWSPLANSIYLHGKLLGYTVIYQPITIANESLPQVDRSESSVVVGPQDLSVQLSSLNIFTRYEISVSAFTRKGNGPRSEAIVAGKNMAQFLLVCKKICIVS